MTQVQIVNLGLAHISQRAIQTMADATEQAAAASLVWEPCLRECLRGNNWAFASVLTALTANITYTLPTGWQYAYNYPTNGVAVWRISNDFTPCLNKKGEDFRIVYDSVNDAQIIITNCQTASAEFTYYVTNTLNFDAAFINVLSYRLAAALAMPLNADADLAINMTKIFTNQMSEAQRQSSYENNVNNGESSDAIVNSRLSGISGTQSVSIGGETFDQWNHGN